MLKRISGFHKSDFVPDVPAHITDASALSEARNVRLRNGKLVRFLGSVSGGITLDEIPEYVLAGTNASVPWWLIVCDGQLVSVSYGVVTDITDVLTPSIGNGWVGEVVNGLAVLTNGVDDPIYWLGTGDAAVLPNWPPGDLTSCSCQFIRGFKNRLIAGNLTEDSTVFPNVFRWSHDADPGAAPVTWDIMDTTKDAGRTTLAETPGTIVDGLAFGDVFFLYKTDATYMLQNIGGVFILRVTPLSLTSGMMNKNCAANTPKGQVVLSQTDVVLVNPSGIQSLGDGRIRDRLFASVRATARDKCFVAANAAMTEVWVCVPVNSDYPDTAFVWNYATDKWTVRELPGVVSITFGQAQTTGLLIEDAVMLIEDAEFLINSLSDALFQVFGVSATESSVLVFDRGNSENGTEFEVLAAHYGYDFGDVGKPEDLVAERIKHVTKLRPHFSADTAPGVTVMFYVGIQMELGDPIDWSSGRQFVVGDTRDLFFRKNGRYISWKIEAPQGSAESYVTGCYWEFDYAEDDSVCNINTYWELDGVDMTFELGGVY